ncbi:MAG: MaoC/PaaZ C-terminal domain-containing protein [Myxococcota bacterium]
MADKLCFEDVNEGDAIPAFEQPGITKVQLVQYAGASHDYNLLHTDDGFARMAGMPNGVIAHGMLSMGFAGQFLAGWAGLENVRKVSVRFTAVTEPGDVVTATGKIVKKYEEDGEKRVLCEIATTTQNGTVTTTGQGVVALPAKG